MQSTQLLGTSPKAVCSEAALSVNLKYDLRSDSSMWNGCSSPFKSRVDGRLSRSRSAKPERGGGVSHRAWLSDDGIDALSGTGGLTTSGTVRLVACLVDQGLRPGHDGRAVSLRLTKAGHGIADRVLTSRRQRMRAAFASLTNTEQW